MAVKDLVAHALNEVLTANPKIPGLQDAIGTLLETEEAVEKISNSILAGSPLLNSVTKRKCRTKSWTLWSPKPGRTKY